MPPKQILDISFEQWLEEVVKLPVSIVNDTFAVIKTKHNQYLVWQLRTGPADPSLSPDSIITAFAESQEALSDLKGVNTVIKLQDLIRDPSNIRKVLRGTFDDIVNLDEISQDRRGEAMGRLVKGYVTDGENGKPNGKYLDIGTRLDQPDNAILKTIHNSRFIPINFGFPINTQTGKSEIQLMVDTTNGKDPNMRGEWEDIAVAQEGLDKRKTYKPYQGLASALTNLSSEMESTPSRIANRNDAVKEYSRAVAQELGIDLEKVLNQGEGGEVQGVDVKKDKRLQGSSYGKVGSFHDVLSRKTSGNIMGADGNIERLLSNDSLIEEALHLQKGSFKKMHPRMQSFYKEFLRSEEINLRLGYRLKPSDAGKTLLKKWEAAGIDPKLLGTSYDNEFTELWLTGDLEHVKSQVATRMYMQIDAYGKNIRAGVSEAIEQQYWQKSFNLEAGKLRMKRKINGLTDAQIEQQARAAADQFVQNNKKLINDATGRSLGRLRSATRAVDIANDLFAASTVKELLESVHNGSFIKSVFITSRLFGALPGMPKEMRSASEWAAILEPATLERKLDKLLSKVVADKSQREWLNPITILDKKVKGNVAHWTGLVLNQDKIKTGLHGPAKIINAVTGGGLEANTWVDWAQRDSSGNVMRIYSFAKIKAKNFQGVFNDFGVFHVFSQIEKLGLNDPKNNSSLQGAFKIDEIFANPQKLDDFYKKLREAGLAYEKFMLNPKAGFKIPEELRPYAFMLKKLGLLGKDKSGKYLFHSAFEQFEVFRNNGALNTLISFGNRKNNPLAAIDRWDLLKRMAKLGKADEIARPFIGLLDKYNRYANLARNYFYKNIIFGTALTRLPIIGPIYKPIQGFIRGLGFSDTMSIAETIKRWKWIRKMRIFGKGLSTGNFKIASKLYGKGVGKIVGKLAGKAIGRLLLRLGAKVLLATTAVLTGGISWLISFAAETIFKVSLKLLKGDIKGAGKVIVQDIKGLFITIKKVVIYPITLACCSACLIPVILAMAIVGIISTIIPLENQANPSPPTYEAPATNRVEVEKRAYSLADGIGYEITIKNISPDEDISISYISDRLSLNFSCGLLDWLTGHKIYQYGESGFVGTIEADQPITSLVGQSLAPGAQLQYQYRLMNITEDDADYTNFVEVSVAQDGGRTASDSISYKIGDGGCNNCPAGWPTSNGSISQGPDGGFSHGSVQAIDVSIGLGNSVRATHNGVVQNLVYNSNCGANDHGSDCGWGNYVIVESPLGYRTLYAHLSGYAKNNNDSVRAGDEIGYTGNSGYSTGPHLHYEFLSNFQCYPGHPLSMKNISNVGNGQSYIPKDVPIGCATVADCNVSY